MYDRNCGYNPNYNQMPMPPIMPYQNMPIQSTCNNEEIIKKIDMLEKRVSNLEKIVNPNSYNNYQMM